MFTHSVSLHKYFILNKNNNKSTSSHNQPPSRLQKHSAFGRCYDEAAAHNLNKSAYLTR